MAGSPLFFPEGGQPIPNESDSRILQKIHGVLWDTMNSGGGGGGGGGNVNVTQVNTAAVNVGNGTSGTGTLRVAIASDNTAFSVNSNTATIAGTTAATGNGVVGAGVQRVAIASDNTAFSVNSTSNTATIAGTATATGNGVVSAGVQRVAIASDNTAFSVNATLVPGTSGGSTPSLTISAATTNATSVKGSAGQLYGFSLYNNGASAAYVKIFNKASAPTVGVDTPVQVIMLPSLGGSNQSFDNGIAFGTGIAFCITGLPANSDTTAVALSQVIVNLIYK